MMAWVLAVAACFASPATDAARVTQVERMYAGYRLAWAGRGVPEITAEALSAKLDAHEPIVLVDVRTPAERAVSTLPGAVAADEIDAHPERYRERPLVAYCTIGYRSGLWAAEHRAAGFDVTNLKGSVLAWSHIGRPFAGPEGDTKRVHVYGPTWDLARSDYTAVW